MDKFFKRNTVIAAKELRYPESYIQRIEAAKTEQEITRIMKEARLRDVG